MISKENRENRSEEISEVFYTVCPVESTSHLAVHKGFLSEAFKALGVNLSHISSLPKQEWITHYTHENPTFFRDGGNIPPIWTRSRGADNVVIGLTFPQRKQVIMVRKESEIQSIQDLKGKKVALPKRKGAIIDFWRATVHRGLVCSLLANGLKEEDVEMVDVMLEDYFAESGQQRSIWSHKTDFKAFVREETDALEDGKVDAVYTEGARVGGIEASNKFKVIYNLSSHQDRYYKVNICLPCVITVSGELARNHPKIVEGYMEVLVKAGSWAKQHHEEVVEIFSKELYIDPDSIIRSFPDNFNELLVPSLDNDGVRALEIEKEFLRGYGYINDDFKVGDWIDSRFLEKALRLVA